MTHADDVAHAREGMARMARAEETYVGICPEGHKVLALEPYQPCGYPLDYDVDWETGEVDIHAECGEAVHWKLVPTKIRDFDWSWDDLTGEEVTT